MKTALMTDRRLLRTGCVPLLFFVGLLVFSILPADAFCEDLRERPLLDQALENIGGNRTNLSIRPDLFDNPYAFGTFGRWMANPLKAPAEARHIARGLLSLAPRPSQWLRHLAGPGDLDPIEVPIVPEGTRTDLPEDLPAPLKKAVTLLLDAMEAAELSMKETGAPRSSDEKDLFEKVLYPDLTEEQTRDVPHEDFTRTGEFRQALEAAGKTDREKIFRSALSLAAAMEEAVEILSASDFRPDEVPSRTFMTSVGRVEIGGSGHDVHGDPAALVIDVGGDDTYMGRVASGRDGRCALVLDLEGNDVYTGGHVTQGAGFWGIGILWDLEGDDLYRAGRCGQGAGLFGVGLLIDGGGADLYIGESFVQAASLWGWGGLIDLEGEDSYQCLHAGQAYAEVMGVSCLTDVRGNDKYLSGARKPDPREPDMNESFSQGFAVGMRNLSGGGIALLAEGQGNDLYQCGYFGQGSSYWMGVGILYDERGKDTYVARRYSQGAGIHFSLGLLLDSEGNDHTFSWAVSQGCGHDYGIGLLINESGDDTYVSDWLSLGASEANGVGIFMDYGGNDGYDNPKGMGTGHLTGKRRAGGLGLFIDAGGLDRYSGPGADNTVWGPNRWSVGLDGTGSIAGDADPVPAEETSPVNPEAEREKREEEERLKKWVTRAESLPSLKRIEVLLASASHWGHEREIPADIQERLLLLNPGESVPGIVNLLDTPNIMSLIFMEKFFSAHAGAALPALMNKTEDPDPLVISRALYFLGMLKDTRARTVCRKALDHPSGRIRAPAIRALGEMLDKKRLKDLVPMRDALLNARETRDPTRIDPFLQKDRAPLRALSVLARAVSLDYARYKYLAETPGEEGKEAWLREHRSVLFEHVEELTALLDEWIGDIRSSEKIAEMLEDFLDDPDPAVRKAAVFSLGQMEYAPALNLLMNRLKDSDPWVRDAAILALSRFGDTVVGPLDVAMEREDAPFRILALDALGRINTGKSEKITEKYLYDPHPGVRHAAEQAVKDCGK